jgi:hypothetical protein
MTIRPVAAIALMALVAGCTAEPQTSTANAAVAAAPGIAPSGLALVPLQIRGAGRAHRFTVEVAASEEEQSRGLMFRERLGANEGMIFPFPAPRPASFWMKNTLIPLDMIFISADGTIQRIVENTVPHSLQSVSSYGPVTAVLEIAGGRSAQLGLKEGDRVSWPGGPS